MMSFVERLKELLRGNGIGDGQDSNDAEVSGSCRSISCREALEKVHEYLDGELDGASDREVAHHFAMCKKCYPHLRFEEHFKEAVRRSQRGEVCPESLRSQVLELLEAEAGGPPR